jgi:hypothetical protein
VAGVLNDDLEPTVFGNDRGHCGANQRPRNDVKRNGAHGTPVRSFDGSILPGSIWPKTSDAHRG